MLRCPTCGKQYPTNVQFCLDDQSPLQAVIEEIVDPLIGQVLDGKYRIEQELGVGGMGKVYRASQQSDGHPVAVKILHDRLVEDAAARTRFSREVKAAGRLTHVNTVAVTDFGQTEEGHVYLVMELLEGRTLREMLAKEAPLETARAVSFMLQVSAAVAAAHEAGVIHRDLKPANIFVTQSPDAPSVVKVLDFGIAKLAAESLDEDEPRTLSPIGVMVGTPRYMSPEQCEGLELTPASDVYSLGVILYEMLTGMVPFSGSSPAAIALKHSSEYPRPPREIVAAVPSELEIIVLYALEKDPANRPSNAAEFRNQLVRLVETLGLEHHALIASPDIAALRDVAKESPSGRLVVDLSKLREGRVLTSGGNEINVVGQSDAARPARDSGPANEHLKRQGLRNEVEVGQRRNGRLWLASGLLLVVVAVAVIAFLMLPVADSKTPVATNSNAIPKSTKAPTPIVSPGPTYSTAPGPAPTAEKSGTK
jgi:serine/threonine-protein kinase